jgi:hypothetical protein
MALCDTDDVAARLGGISFTTSESAVVADLITAAQAHIERVAERTLEAAAREEVFDPPETPNIWLSHTPVITASTTTPFSVEVDGTALSSDQYSVNPDTGRLTRVTNGRPRSWSEYKVRSITVEYEGGYSTVPGDLLDICARVAARNYQAGQASLATDATAVKSVDIEGAGSVAYADEAGDVSVSAFITPEEMEAIKYYRNEYLV